MAVKRIEYMCTHCGKKEIRFVSAGKPQPGKCPRKILPQTVDVTVVPCANSVCKYCRHKKTSLLLLVALWLYRNIKEIFQLLIKLLFLGLEP